VSYSVVQQAARILPGEREIISLEPNTIWDILENIRLVGEKTGKGAEAEALVARFKRRIEAVREKTAHRRQRPRVYCMEWLDPPFAAGHWIAEMVSLAGGLEGLARHAQPSVAITWEEVLRFAPEILILMPCGFNLEQTVGMVREVQAYPGWPELPAVRNGQVFAVDGSGYFNRPGPRIVDGLEILAEIICPDAFSFPQHQNAFRKLAV